MGIDNSVKVAKIITDLNAKIDDLKKENTDIQEQLKDSLGREEVYQKRLNDAHGKIGCLQDTNKGIHAANKVLVEELNKAKQEWAQLLQKPIRLLRLLLKLILHLVSIEDMVDI